jgi:hypothetical protein
MLVAGMLLSSVNGLHAQVCQDFVVDLGASVVTNPPQITLNWALRLSGNITNQTLYRRLKGESSWTFTNALTTNTTSFVDSSVSAGVEYEYWLARKLNVYGERANGYLSAGINVPFVENRGKLILIVDDSMTNALAPELSQLQQDLIGDGWTVLRHDVPRMSVDPANTNSSVWVTRSNELAYVKNLIVTDYNADSNNVKAVYLLGRTPVPYSGNFAPDGHGDHIGAWGANGFYGDINGNWTDSSVNRTGGSDLRNWNVPGDGKFDQSYIPSDLELQVGRVDMANMTKFPTAAVTETNLLRRYLRKAHDYRHGKGAYADIARRAMLRDGFGYFGGERFAASAWGAIYSSLGRTSTVWEAIASGTWFVQPETNNYLFAYGNGGGSWEIASSVGTSTDFGDKPSRAVFTGLFGSYFGDWDRGNVLLRAPLAGNARGNSYGLTCLWSGRPSWFLHHMGMGETIGYAARLSQNNWYGEYDVAGYSTRGVHVGLMGDPALRFYALRPPQNLMAQSYSGTVRLIWSAIGGILGCHVFRADSMDAPFVRLTVNPVIAANYLDTNVTAGVTYTYMVRVLKLETVPGGTFQNLGQGAFVTITASSSATSVPRNPTNLQVSPLASNQIILNWQDNSTNETGFRIERRDGPGANFVTIATVGSGTNTFTDTGPLPNGTIYYYRVIATGSAGDSPSSNEAYADGDAGFIELPTSILRVDKSASNAVVFVDRYGGSNGAVSVTCFTTNSSAVAGTHYTGLSNTFAFADGVASQQIVNIPLLDIGQPQLPRSFRFVARPPTGGANPSWATNTVVLIEDATATLATPWQSTILGTPTDYGPAVSAEGVIGSSIYGGAISTGDDLRFIYQILTNNVVLTAKIEAPLLAQNAARYGLMMRTNLVRTGPMVLLWLPGDSSGAKLGYRSVDSGSVTYLPSASNSNRAPYWLRLARIGNNFIGETSTNGVNWITLTNITQSTPVACYWGLFHYSDPNIKDFQLATFSNLSIVTNVVPTAPTGLSATPAATNRVNLAWNDSDNEDIFSIERRLLGGSFASIGSVASNTITYTDLTAAAATTYEYRICSTNHWGLFAYSQIVTATTYTAYQQWCADNTLPLDGSGNGAPTADPAGDGIPNLMKHALGLNAFTNGYQGHLVTGTTNISSQTYLTLTYTRPEPAPPGLTYTVEVANDLVVPDWSSAETVEIGNTVNGAWRTVIVRDQYPVADRPKRFIHLRVTQ